MSTETPITDDIESRYEDELPTVVYDALGKLERDRAALIAALAAVVAIADRSPAAVDALGFQNVRSLRATLAAVRS